MSKQKEVPALFVRSLHEPYRRAGFAFSRAGIGIALSALSKEQIKALQEDPRLVVEECTFPADAVAAAEAEKAAAEAAAKAEAEKTAAEAAAIAEAEKAAAEAAAKAEAEKAAAKAGKGKGAK